MNLRARRAAEDRESQRGDAGRTVVRRVRLPLVTPVGVIGVVLLLTATLFVVGQPRQSTSPTDPHIALKHHTSVMSLVYSHDGAWLAWADWDGTVAIFDPRTQGNRATFAFPIRGQGPLGLAFFPNDSILTASYADDRVIFWDVNTRLERVAYPDEGITGSRFAISADGRFLACSTGSRGECIQLHEAATGRSLGTLGKHLATVRSIAFATCGSILASGDTGGAVKLWDVSTSSEIATLPAPAGPRYAVNSLAFTPDGATLAAANVDRRLMLCDVSQRRYVSSLGDDDHYFFTVAFSPDGRSLVSAGANGIECWDVATRARRFVSREHEMAAFAIAFSPDGRQVASAGVDGTVRLWEFDADRQVLR